MAARASIFGVGLLDDLHSYFPDILYRPERFGNSVQALLGYIQQQARSQFNPFDRGQQIFNQFLAMQTPPPVNNQDIINAINNNNNNNRIVTPVEPVQAEAIRTPLRPRTNRNLIPQRQQIPVFQSTFDGGGLSNLVAALFGGEHLLEPVYITPSFTDISNNTIVSTLMAASPENCAICQDGMAQNETVRTIRTCRHMFHTNCIDEWFRTSACCPNCRVDIRTPPS